MHPKKVGKREFIQHTSKYIKLVEDYGAQLIITHQSTPDLILNKIKPKSLKDLRGSVIVEIYGDLNEPVLLGYDQW